MNFDPRIDAYIEKIPAYAKPIVIHLRNLIHKAEPGIVETIKWGHPHFDYQGPVIGLAAFKEHMGINFWKSTLMDDPEAIFADGSAGSLGKIKSIGDLPADNVLIAYIRNAVKLNNEGIKVSKKNPATEKKELEVAGYLVDAFKTNTKAMQHFEQFSPSAKREYLEWLYEAKTEATRQKRLETMMEWVSEGKTRHWKYKK